ncbi:25.3 kDa vesicle transport protein SEC22-1 [Cannabis sativa]|uniref:25.3 kDa vesicle transport protein SEC22-1 n=1 Tax=Cannabis sativa TaxID=3483 RepID=UPI0029C9E087|nr:25.3 kDa vesicle transport protein SEC22-1 [Cannabis sativa]
MVKVTIVGRVKEGLPLAQGPRYVNKEENKSFLFYKQQGELILKEISRGSLPHSKMTIRIDHQYCFNYLVENEIAIITLSDSSYPRKLAFHYLQDLQKEFQKFDSNLIEKITRPYSFIGFDSVIVNIRKQYIDTRTQANLSKLNANRKQELDIVTENLTEILERRRNSELHEIKSSPLSTPRAVSSIWGSSQLEVIALKWTPITIVLVVLVVVSWAGLIITDSILISSSY